MLFFLSKPHLHCLCSLTELIDKISSVFYNIKYNVWMYTPTEKDEFMNPIETGKVIAVLRKEAGYTQASLAAALGITDKAVSKWECGKGLPDSSLLPQLAKLLDCDVEMMIFGLSEYRSQAWRGRLILENDGIFADTVIFDKPLICYLISYFMLVGIKDIEIHCCSADREYIKSLDLEKYGLNLSFTQCKSANTMIVHGKFILFGSNITRIFQSIMSGGENIIPVVDGIEIPLVFSAGCNDSIDLLKSISSRKKLGRGIINIPLNDEQQVKDAAEFVRIYQKYHGLPIGDLNEIAHKRGFI